MSTDIWSRLSENLYQWRNELHCAYHTTSSALFHEHSKSKLSWYLSDILVDLLKADLGIWSQEFESEIIWDHRFAYTYYYYKKSTGILHIYLRTDIDEGSIGVPDVPLIIYQRSSGILDPYILFFKRYISFLFMKHSLSKTVIPHFD